MKKALSRIVSLLLVLCLVTALVPAVFAADENEVQILFLDTSDVHGQQFATDYTQDASLSGTHYQGMTRVATYVKEQRAEYKNVFLSDSGDTIQGTPLTYYYAFMKKDVDDPAMKVMRMMDYDMWVVGNHEFNYGMDILQRQLNYLTSESTETESKVGVSMANYLDANTNNDKTRDWKTWNGYAPYVIKEYDGVKVAVMGIGNPNIANWDVPENWKGIYFAGVVETYKHYEAEMKAQADLIVLVSHSGIDGDPEKSDFIRELVSTTNSIDLVFSGHEHRNGVTKIANTDGKEIPVISPGTKAGVVGRALFTYNKATKTYTVEAANAPMTVREGRTTKPLYEPDADLTAALQPYEDATWNEYMLKPIGTASDNFTASGLGTAPSAFVDLVNKVQIWGAYDRTGKNTPDDKTDDKPAQLSITAPLTSGNAENLIPKGDIKLGDMFRLYRYENWFYQITMSGKEVRTWLEYSASKVRANEDGTFSIQGGLTYYDVISGEGFSYEINAAAPSGHRIENMTYNGKAVQDTDTFTVVINNYRFNGGGNFIQYINEHGCNFVPNDESRVIYSTQYDMIQGEDKGQARNLLADYITEQGTIDPVITSEWKITNVPFENKFTDVTEEDWFHDVVLELAASGVVNGMTETTFEPQGTLTRAEFATMLYRVSYAPVVTGESTYSDVKTGDWYYNAVVWATEAGVVNGMGDGTFAPNDNITRQEMATMLYRLAKAEKVEEDKLASFPDAASVADWAKDAMNWAVSTEIVNGSTHDDKVNYLDPTATALRCQAAAVACRYLALSK